MRFTLWQVWGMLGDILEYWGLAMQAQCARHAWTHVQESAERCSMCLDGISHSARCHHDEHEVCDRVAEGTDAPRSCACPCHSPGDLEDTDG